MREYVVTCCSTADMSRTFMETNEVPFAMFHYQLDGKEYADDLYSSISPEVFYKMIGDGAQPVTSQVNAEAYCALFEPVLKSGKDVLHLTLSSGISGSINSANVAKTQMEEKYPDRRVMVVDSLAASSGYGMLVEQTLENQRAGMSLEENAAWIVAHRNTLASLVFLNRFNQLYPWRKSFQNRRIFRKDAQYLSAAECEFRGQADSAQQIPWKKTGDP